MRTKKIVLVPQRPRYIARLQHASRPWNVSTDSVDIPLALIERLTRPTSAAPLAAMEFFISRGDEAAFEKAVAIYVSAARKRGEPVEMVLGVCCQLAASLEGPRVLNPGEVAARPTRMHELIFSGILRAFYGDVAIERATGARAQRKADAPQHLKSQTWPRPPAD